MLFPTDSFPINPVVETKKALILLDLQNDFVSPDGKLYVSNSSSFVKKLPDLAARFREQGEVVWTKTTFRQPCSALSVETGGFCILLKQFLKSFAGQHDESSSNHATPGTEEDGSQAYADHTEPNVESDLEAFLALDIKDRQRCCVAGTTGSEFPASLKAAMDKKDIVTTKSQYSAFADMLLLLQLRTRRVTDLYICGSLSNISVYATALDAVRHGFQVTVVEDCLGYRSELCHVHAMKQMADNMCVEGIDYQELMDDLAGLLGDVVKEGTYTTQFEINLSRPTLAEKRRASARTVDQWITGIQPGSFVDDESSREQGNDSIIRPDSSDSDVKEDSFSELRGFRQRSPTVDSSSPPRKRSTNDLDGDLEVSPHVRLSHQGSIRRSSYDAYARSDPRAKKIKQRVRSATKDYSNSSGGARRSSLQRYASAGFQPQDTFPPTEKTPPRSMDETGVDLTISSKKSKKASTVFLGPDDKIGDGTSRTVHNALSPAFANSAFELLKANIAWQKMYHKSGEVPRLVAVQGDVVISSVDNSTTYPIYRHPADDSPALLPFDHTVETLRRECEKHVGHTLNHVLIQHYRNGEDNISEHSDKTLDIVRGSSIVNLSLGAMRTMTLRTKSKRTGLESEAQNISPKSSPQPHSTAPPLPPPTSHPQPQPTPRTTQRIHLPHASLFILSTSTNAKFLHSVRADKRRPAEKSPDELAFNGERISLTFRHVATYITEVSGSQLIWGQGATGKTRGEAKDVLRNDDDKDLPSLPEEEQAPASETQDHDIPHPDVPEQTPVYDIDATSRDDVVIAEQSKSMLLAFGKENHEDDTFDWEGAYGRGFDVVNFVTRLAGETS